MWRMWKEDTQKTYDSIFKMDGLNGELSIDKLIKDNND